MKHGSLFSGIGGFDLAAQWMGWTNVFHCELNPFCHRVLKYYWPETESLKDIKTTDFKKYAGTIDVLSGGFPCQPYSLAGKRKGKEDERHLWPEMLRAIREIQPRWVVGENVRGLVNWNGGMVFDEVHSDLELAGYEVQAVVIPAAAVNAPHGRDRVWFVGRRIATDTEGERHEPFDAVRTAIVSAQIESRLHGRGSDTQTLDGLTADTGCTGWEKHNTSEESDKPQFTSRVCIEERGNWQNFPTQSPICSGDDGLPTRLDGITFSKWRNESIKAYGNAIVPQVAYEIFKPIEKHEKQNGQKNIKTNA